MRAPRGFRPFYQSFLQHLILDNLAEGLVKTTPRELPSQGRSHVRVTKDDSTDGDGDGARRCL
jgi:hypothetical protein